MASALLASRDETRDQHRWAESKVYMRKGLCKSGSKTGFDSQGRAGQNGGREQQQARMAGHDKFEAAAAAVSDDSSSLNRKSINVNHDARREPDGGLRNVDTILTFNISSFSADGIRDLRRRLTHELEQVRNLYTRLEAKEIQLRGGYSNVNASYSASQFSGNDVRNYGGKEVTSGMASGGLGQVQRPMPLNLSAVDNNMAGGDGGAAKEKRTPKANQYYRNSEFLTGKDKMPPPDNKKVGNKRKLDVRDAKHPAVDPVTSKLLGEVMKQCGVLLTKLMKHKFGWVFNNPVDVVGLGLHDYNTIIKAPMDLGTVKSKLSDNQYNSPHDFAVDIRLTFNNAMVYNPEGHEVHGMAKQLLQFFEERWKTISGKYEEEKKKYSWPGEDRFMVISPNVKQLPINDIPKKNLKKTEPILGPSPPPPQKAKPKSGATIRTPAPKKPKAKDPHKREMSYEEKQKLSGSLQSLPPEKLENIVQIIKKRNPALCQQEDEIEVDIDCFDTETLWELDRFVNNCKKTMNKNKKKVNGAEPVQSAANNEVTAREESPPVTVLADTSKKNNKKGDQGEEDVDIDDDMPSTNFPPVEIDKDGGYGSRSSSSSSSSSDSGSSSSGTDSDSGSSSGSDSDAEDANSPGVGSKALPRSS